MGNCCSLFGKNHPFLRYTFEKYVAVMTITFERRAYNIGGWADNSNQNMVHIVGKGQ